jgi:predicted RNA-binding Zn ribbon-like protein
MAVTSQNEPHVRFVREFVNTHDVDDGTDELSSPAALAAWLRQRTPLGDDERATDADLALARELREALRAELRSHHGVPAGAEAVDAAEARERLDALAADLPLRVAFTGFTEPPALAPGRREGARAGLAAILVSVAALAQSGEWRRLKVCPADDCQVAFYDQSRNHSRRWCSMEACGNRSKLRAFRERGRYGE